MSVRETNEVINIIDATTGQIIEVVKVVNYTKETIATMLKDIFIKDYMLDKHGFLIKYGIKQ